MYKAIIADDEETVRRGLVTHFNWGKHGVEVAGVFDDGVPALDFVRRNEVDIIVTDVRMSHMDGITLAKNVLESYPGVKIIFISGYADVGYLRDALKMEAVDYILKSIDIDAVFRQYAGKQFFQRHTEGDAVFFRHAAHGEPF